MTGVWVATLERFGYTLMVVERTKQKAMDAIVKTYEDAYLVRSEYDNIEDLKNDPIYCHDFEYAMEEVYCRKMEYGKVEWC